MTGDQPWPGHFEAIFLPRKKMLLAQVLHLNKTFIYLIKSFAPTTTAGGSAGETQK